MAETRTPLLRGGAADLDVLVNEDSSSYTVVQVTPEGDYRLFSGRNGGGHIEHVAHPSPNASLFPATESGHVAFPPG
jgi:hypothetical protein